MEDNKQNPLFYCIPKIGIQLNSENYGIFHFHANTLLEIDN